MIEDGQLWRHFKGGLYRTRDVAQPIRDIGAESFSQLCAARHSETLNNVAIPKNNCLRSMTFRRSERFSPQA
jgi:hypothetical protein